MALCETENTILAGPCRSEGRWVGPDGKVRCSLHQVNEFGHSEPLVKVEDYEPPKTPETKSKSKKGAEDD